jgi:hypothetical protein
MIGLHVPLLINASASGAAQTWPGGMGVFSVCGTFSGATVTLEFLGPDLATYISAGGNTTLTSANAGVFYLPACQIKAVVSGGSPSGLYAAADRIAT